MKSLILLIIIMLLIPLAITQGQQRDSLILQGTTVDSGWIGFIPVRIWAVTYDSVFFYNWTLHWHAPFGGIIHGLGTFYYPPLTSWGRKKRFH
jgi:hypothetical protein